MLQSAHEQHGSCRSHHHSRNLLFHERCWPARDIQGLWSPAASAVLPSFKGGAPHSRSISSHQAVHQQLCLQQQASQSSGRRLLTAAGAAAVPAAQAQRSRSLATTSSSPAAQGAVHQRPAMLPAQPQPSHEPSSPAPPRLEPLSPPPQVLCTLLAVLLIRILKCRRSEASTCRSQPHRLSPLRRSSRRLQPLHLRPPLLPRPEACAG